MASGIFLRDSGCRDGGFRVPRCYLGISGLQTCIDSRFYKVLGSGLEESWWLCCVGVGIYRLQGFGVEGFGFRASGFSWWPSSRIVILAPLLGKLTRRGFLFVGAFFQFMIITGGPEGNTNRNSPVPKTGVGIKSRQV